MCLYFLGQQVTSMFIENIVKSIFLAESRLVWSSLES